MVVNWWMLSRPEELYYIRIHLHARKTEPIEYINSQRAHDDDDDDVDDRMLFVFNHCMNTKSGASVSLKIWTSSGIDMNIGCRCRCEYCAGRCEVPPQPRVHS